MVNIVAHSAKLLHERILYATMQYERPSPAWDLLTRRSAPMSFFVATDTGEIVYCFSQDMTLVDTQLPAAFMLTVSSEFTHAVKGMLLTGAVFMGAIAQIALTCVASGRFAISIVGLLTILFY